MATGPGGQLRVAVRRSPVLAFGLVKFWGPASVCLEWADYYDACALQEVRRKAEARCDSFWKACVTLGESFREFAAQQSAPGNSGPVWTRAYMFWWAGGHVPIPPGNAELVATNQTYDPRLTWVDWRPHYTCPQIGQSGVTRPECLDETHCWVCVAEFPCPISTRAVGRQVTAPASLILEGARLLAGRAWSLPPRPASTCKCPPVGGEPPPMPGGVRKAFTAVLPTCYADYCYDFYPTGEREDILQKTAECHLRAAEQLSSGVATEIDYLNALCFCNTGTTTLAFRDGLCEFGEDWTGEEPEVEEETDPDARELFAVHRALKKASKPWPPGALQRSVGAGLVARVKLLLGRLQRRGGATKPRRVTMERR